MTNLSSETVARALIDAALQGALLLAGCAALVLVLRRRLSASARHLAWALGLLGLFALWAPTPSFARWRVNASPAPRGVRVASPVDWSAPRAEVPAPVTAAPSVTNEPRGPAPASVASVEAASASRSAWTWHGALVALWLVGAALSLAPYVMGLFRARRLVRSARPLARPLEPALAAQLARHRARLLESPLAGVPMTVGFLRPVVLVPPAFAAWPAARRNDALRHELAHVRRADWLTRLVARVAVALHWFDPLAWLAERRLRLESERACDDAVLAAGGASTDYAASLVDVARSLRGAAPPAAAIAMARGTQLERRLRAILDPARRRGGVGRGARGLALATSLAAAGALGGLAVARSAQDAPVVEVAAGGSIQAAVDAAPAGALVRVAAGTFEERVTITKPLTLEGAGWDATRVEVAYRDATTEDAALQRELAAAMAAAETPEAKRAARERFLREHGPQPVLRVRGASGVVVRGLSLAQPGEGREGAVLPGAVVELEDAGALVEDCAVLGTPGSGVTIAGASEVELRRCLVADAEATGIAVSGAGPRVLVAECDVRNCRHRGITIGGNEKTTVERCRISGSAWHGVRYDGGAPRILGNRIERNERSGIYASGETRAEVRGNLFLENGHNGISCWFQNRDTISGNTFVADRREAISVLGASRPAIRRNLFVELEKAVYLGNIGSESDDATTSGEVDLQGNAFWKVERRREVGPDPSAGELALGAAGNRELEPGFVAPAEGDYALAADSPARAAGIGAPDPPPPASPWPAQAEEVGVVAQRTEAEQRQAEHAASFQAAQLAQPWIEDLLQLQDVAKRDTAAAALRAALASEDATERHAALTALTQTSQATYDRAGFAALVRPFCRSERGPARVKAFYALNLAGREPGDERLLLAALEEPSPALRDAGTHLLMLYFDGRLEGEAGAAALRLLDGASERSLRQVLGGLWGAQASPELQQRLLELARDPATRHDAIYFGLSTLANKSRAVVEHLIEVLASPDWNDSTRALWGLQQGVAPAEQALVADAALALFEARGQGQTRAQCLDLVARHGGEQHLPALRALADNELVPEELRAKAREIAAAIESR